MAERYSVDQKSRDLPDFTVYGFHTGKQVRYRTADGQEHVGIYQGWGIFGTGQGRQDVTAWAPAEDASSQLPGAP